MRILIVSSEFPPGPGGIGTHAYQLASRLSSYGWQVVVLTSQDYASSTEINAFNREQPFEIIQLHQVPVPPLEALYRIVILARLIVRWLPDVTIASGERSAWIVAILQVICPMTWVAIGHGTEFASRYIWEVALTRWAYHRASSVICVSQYTLGRMARLMISPKRAIVIHNGADERVFTSLNEDIISSFRRKYQLDNARILLTVGNVTERKAQDVVVRALPYILAVVPDVHYLIVGLPTRKAELLGLAQKLGVGERVHFTGKISQSELVSAYNLCEIFVITSRHASDGDFEGYGIVVVEAALCGKPSVVSQGSGLEEAVLEELTGLTVPENDPENTAQAIIKMLQNSDFRAQLGRQAQLHAQQHQTWAGRISAYVNELEIVSGRSPINIDEPKQAPQ